MDREELDQDREQQVAHEEPVVDGLEQHAAHHETHAASGTVIPGIDGRGLDSSAEHGAQQDHDQQANAVQAINQKVAAKRTQAWQKREDKRLGAAKARIKKRAKGAAWTADALAEIMKHGGGQAVLVQLNTHQPHQGIEMLKLAHQWGPMLDTLPRGHLNGDCKHALREMVSDGVFGLPDAERLFGIRFNHDPAAVAGGKQWTLTNLESTWRQLAGLPAEDVTLNTAITTFSAVAGGGGTFSGSVNIGQDTGGDLEYLEHTVRHEVGHGVHAQLEADVDAWLKNDVQFAPISWDELIADLGGYPKQFHDPASGQNVVVDAQWKTYLKTLIENYTGSGSWTPTKATPDAGEVEIGKAAWSAMPHQLKHACAMSTASWYQNYQHFQEWGGKRYFVNHWYHTPYVMGAPAMQGITATNDTYSAMSDKEFFANCYAEYFNDPKGVAHHNLWGGNLPAKIKSFFSSVVLSRHPYTAWQKQQKANKPT